ncbi:thioredoxin family protein, partial [Candidatus Woesebacteria bacterium]|nr:thioredoxin family protein [Candidatus Woesebacteria bacterium]
VPYTATALAQASTGRRVLFFYANWCPTCRPADADFSANLEKFPADLTVVRVNYNDTDTDAEEKSLAEKYGITYQHTFVQIDADGNELARWNGGQTAELLANLK